MGATPVRIEVKGATELSASLKRLGADVNDFKDVHKRTGTYIAGQGASRAPKRSGRLAASGRAGATARNVTVRFGSGGIPYANPVHWGTGARAGRRGPHNINPSLFAVRAAHETEPTWTSWYLGELQKMVGRVKGA